MIIAMLDKFTNNKLLFIIALFLCLLMFGQLSLASQRDSNRYTNGFKIYQYNMLPGESVADNPLPNTELGSFTANKSEYSYEEAEKKVGVPVNSGRLYRAYGYLNVKEPGNYTIIAKSGGVSRKYGCIYANGKIAISGSSSPFVLTAPVSFSVPGIYPIDIRIYDNIDRNLVVKNSGYASKAKFSFSVKTPDSETPLPAHKVLLLHLK